MLGTPKQHLGKSLRNSEQCSLIEWAWTSKSDNPGSASATLQPCILFHALLSHQLGGDNNMFRAEWLWGVSEMTPHEVTSIMPAHRRGQANGNLVLYGVGPVLSAGTLSWGHFLPWISVCIQLWAAVVDLWIEASNHSTLHPSPPFLKIRLFLTTTKLTESC